MTCDHFELELLIWERLEAVTVHLRYLLSDILKIGHKMKQIYFDTTQIGDIRPLLNGYLELLVWERLEAVTVPFFSIYLALY